jgi:cell division transport system ATP-binding protein
VQAGEMIYLLGKVGSGKSSFMKTIYGELPLEGDEATALDYNLLKLKRREIPYLRRKIGVVFQDFQLLVDRNVEENLMFVLKATGWKDKQAMKNNIHDVLKQVGMAEKSYKMPYQLSGGEQQRVVIARALLNAPGLILADEPTGNLDPETGKEIMDLLYSISQAGMTVIMSTHNPTWPEQYPGRRLQFAEGKIVEL